MEGFVFLPDTPGKYSQAVGEWRRRIRYCLFAGSKARYGDWVYTENAVVVPSSCLSHRWRPTSSGRSGTGIWFCSHAGSRKQRYDSSLGRQWYCFSASIILQWEVDQITLACRQCCGSGFIEYGSSISSESRSGSRAKVLMTKNWRKKIQWKKRFFIFLTQNLQFTLSLGLLKGHPSFRRSIQSSKENI
jgi:hypothetical protein